MWRTLLRSLAFIIAGAPALLLAQYSEIQWANTFTMRWRPRMAASMPESTASGTRASGLAPLRSIRPAPVGSTFQARMGFNTPDPITASPKASAMTARLSPATWTALPTNGISIQYAAYWVNGVESLVPAPPDDPTPTLMSATGVSGDGTTLIVQDQTANKTESYVFKIASGTFTSLGFLGGDQPANLRDRDQQGWHHRCRLLQSG